MTTRTALLTIALMSVAGLAQAQSASPAPATAPLEDKAGQMTKPSGMPTPREQAMARSCDQRHTVAITDEYGFRYDENGDRLNARGCVIAPPHSLPGAKAL